MLTTRPLLIATLCFALVACGGEDEKKDTADTASPTDTVVDGGAEDTGAADTGSAPKDTGSAPKDTGSTKPDTVAPAKPCHEALQCIQDCPKSDKDCNVDCADGVATESATALKDIETCAVDLCKEVTEGAAAEQNCAFEKCYDKLSSCGDFGAGGAGCPSTVACLAGCTLTDFSCRLECMRGASKDAAVTARDVLVCANSKCANAADQVALGKCLSDNCGAEVKACNGDNAFGCSDIVQYSAKCAPSSSVEPNNCEGIVLGLSDVDGQTAYNDYGTCKEQCTQAVNVVGCWVEKCAAKATACFPKGGDLDCSNIDKCTLDECDGIGGDPTCIQTCLDKGKAASQDAYLIYEGCMVRNMDTKEAKTAKCKFPYDQATCVPVIKGQFCGSEAQNCFTDQ